MSNPRYITKVYKVSDAELLERLEAIAEREYIFTNTELVGDPDIDDTWVYTRTRMTLDGKFTSAQLRAIADAFDAATVEVGEEVR